MPRGMSWSCTIRWRWAAKSETGEAVCPQPVAPRTARIKNCEIRRIANNNARRVGRKRLGQRRSLDQISSCPSCPSWLISPAFHERRTQNTRAPRNDERHRASSSFGVARPRNSDLEDLAGGAVRGGAAGRERFLLRCRSSAPHFAGRFRKDRGRNEKGDQSQPSVRADGSFTR